jgi:small membrane protein
MTYTNLPFQLFLFLILLWPISRVLFRFRDGVIKLGSFLFWLAIWLTGAVAVFFPGFLTYLANFFNIGRGSDLAIYGAIAVLFYLVFRLSVVIENQSNEISQLTREIALKSDSKNKKK